MVGLQSQAEADLSAFEELCKNWPLVRECHMLNGEVDFMLKCVAPDLSSFQSFLTGELLTARAVNSSPVRNDWKLLKSGATHLSIKSTSPFSI